MLRVHQPRGKGLSLRAGGRCSGGVVTEGRPESSFNGFTGLGETECLSMSLVAAREGWSLRGGQYPSRARGRRLSLHACGRCSGGVVIEGRPMPPYSGCSGEGETECLLVPVVAAREGWSLRRV